MPIAPPAKPSLTALTRLARHRLVHFLVLGGALFFVAPRPAAGQVVRVTSTERSALYAAEARRLGVAALTTNQQEEVDRRALEDEVLYREAVRLGLDKTDSVVRQRLVQRVLFLAEDLSGAASAPTNDELRAYYDASRASWTRNGRMHFVHVYVAEPDTPKMQTIAADLETRADADVPALGDAFPLSRDAKLTDEQAAAAYGEPFARAVAELPIGRWSAPMSSKHGAHFVKLLAREAGRQATFEEALPELRLSYVVVRKKRAVAAFVDRACARYTLDFDGPRPVCATSGQTAAIRREGWD